MSNDGGRTPPPEDEPVVAVTAATVAVDAAALIAPPPTEERQENEQEGAASSPPAEQQQQPPLEPDQERDANLHSSSNEPQQSTAIPTNDNEIDDTKRRSTLSSSSSSEPPIAAVEKVEKAEEEAVPAAGAQDDASPTNTVAVQQKEKEGADEDKEEPHQSRNREEGQEEVVVVGSMTTSKQGEGECQQANDSSAAVAPPPDASAPQNGDSPPPPHEDPPPPMQSSSRRLHQDLATLHDEGGGPSREDQEVSAISQASEGGNQGGSGEQQQQAASQTAKTSSPPPPVLVAILKSPHSLSISAQQQQSETNQQRVRSTSSPVDEDHPPQQQHPTIEEGDDDGEHDRPPTAPTHSAGSPVKRSSSTVQRKKQPFRPSSVNTTSSTTTMTLARPLSPGGASDARPGSGTLYLSTSRLDSAATQRSATKTPSTRAATPNRNAARHPPPQSPASRHAAALRQVVQSQSQQQQQQQPTVSLRDLCEFVLRSDYGIIASNDETTTQGGVVGEKKEHTTDETAQQILALDALLRRAPASLSALSKQAAESQGARELVQLGVAFLSSFLAAIDSKSADAVVQSMKRKRADSPTKQRARHAELSSKQLTTFLGPSPMIHLSIVDDQLEVLRQRQDGSHTISVTTIPLSLEIAACNVESGKKELEKAEAALRSWWDAHPASHTVTTTTTEKPASEEHSQRQQDAVEREGDPERPSPSNPQPNNSATTSKHNNNNSSIKRSPSSSFASSRGAAAAAHQQAELASLLFAHRTALESLLVTQENAALVRFVSGELDSASSSSHSVAPKDGQTSSSSAPSSRGAGMLFRGHKKKSVSNNTTTSQQNEDEVPTKEPPPQESDRNAAHSQSAVVAEDATEDLKSLYTVLSEEMAKLDQQIRSLRATPSQVAAKQSTQTKRMLTVDKMDLLLRDRDLTRSSLDVVQTCIAQQQYFVRLFQTERASIVKSVAAQKQSSSTRDDELASRHADALQLRQKFEQSQTENLELRHLLKSCLQHADHLEAQIAASRRAPPVQPPVELGVSGRFSPTSTATSPRHSTLHLHPQQQQRTSPRHSTEQGEGVGLSGSQSKRLADVVRHETRGGDFSYAQQPSLYATLLVSQRGDGATTRSGSSYLVASDLSRTKRLSTAEESNLVSRLHKDATRRQKEQSRRQSQQQRRRPSTSSVSPAAMARARSSSSMRSGSASSASRRRKSSAVSSSSSARRRKQKEKAAFCASSPPRSGALSPFPAHDEEAELSAFAATTEDEDETPEPPSIETLNKNLYYNRRDHKEKNYEGVFDKYVKAVEEKRLADSEMARKLKHHKLSAEEEGTFVERHYKKSVADQEEMRAALLKKLEEDRHVASGGSPSRQITRDQVDALVSRLYTKGN